MGYGTAKFAVAEDVDVTVKVDGLPDWRATAERLLVVPQWHPENGRRPRARVKMVAAAVLEHCLCGSVKAPAVRRGGRGGRVFFSAIHAGSC